MQYSATQRRKYMDLRLRVACSLRGKDIDLCFVIIALYVTTPLHRTLTLTTLLVLYLSQTLPRRRRSCLLREF